MERQSGQTLSLWHATSPELTREPLTSDGRVDVCVVGAGIAGMTTAYLLVRAGRSVIVLDDGPIGGGETGRTTAHLSDAIDDRYHHIQKLHGENGAFLAAHSHRSAIQLIAEIVRRESIGAGFAMVDGYLFPSAESKKGDLEKELDASRRAGVNVIRDDDPVFSPFEARTALRFPGQARLHPLKYLAGLADCVERAGGRILTGTHVSGVQGGAAVLVETSAGPSVHAGACVVATNSPISDYVITHLKQAPYRTFAIAARVTSGTIPDALYWDDADPYHYIRLHKDETGEWLIVGGEDYKTGQESDDEERLDYLESWTRERFPGVESVEYRWSGQVMEPADGLAFIGPNPDGAENVYLVTGDSGQGMTHGTIAGMLLHDLIVGRPNPWARLYDPKRVTLSSAGDLARENLNVAAQYFDWVLPGDVAGGEEVPVGSGRVFRRGAHRVAAYRAADGVLHERSAACTHLQCIVQWNDLEKSWDCPCHGSRFAPTGEVLNGPAIAPLGPAHGEG